MLRITENFDSDHTVRLRLDGTISETSFAEIDEAFGRHIGNSRANTIVLDMAGVVFMNNDAAKKLMQLHSQRVQIINSSPFIEILLNTVSQATPE